MKQVEKRTDSLDSLNDRVFAKIGSEGIRHILGKILTYSDMSFTDLQQRKAFKDIITADMWYWWHSYDLFKDESITEVPELGLVTISGNLNKK